MTETPKHLTGTPQEGDVLSDVLRVVRLTGDLFLKSEFREPWSVLTPSKRELTKALVPSATTFVLFHMIVEGACEVELETGEVATLNAGDVILFPECDVHVLRSGRASPTPVVKLLSQRALDGLFRVHHGGRGTATRMVCGYLACDDPFVAVTRALPPALCMRRTESSVELDAFGTRIAPPPLSAETARWLSSTLQFALNEAICSPPGGRTVLVRLTEVLIVELLRHYLVHARAPSPSLLHAVHDPYVGRALRLLHGSPATRWDVTSLARDVGIGRSVLAERFAALVGEPPMHYLTRWRMQIARTLLLDDARGIAEIARLVGYDSEAAFSRAFRRTTGHAPAVWRRTEARGRRRELEAQPPRAAATASLRRVRRRSNSNSNVERYSNARRESVASSFDGLRTRRGRQR